MRGLGIFAALQSRWKDADGHTILKALQEAKTHPVHRPVDPNQRG